MDFTIAPTASQLTPEGCVDLVSRQQLVDAGMDVLREHRSLTLRLSAVDFMDSVGIGAPIALSKEAASLGGLFVVIEPSPPVQRVLTVTGLGDAWSPIETSTDRP